MTGIHRTALAVGAMALLAGCQSGAAAPAAVPSVPVASSSSASPQQVQAARVVEAFDQLEQTMMGYQATSDWKDAAFTVGAYATADLTKTLVDSLRYASDHGLVDKGTYTWTAKVTAIDLDKGTADIESCLDNSKYDTVFKATGRSAVAPGQIPRFVMLAHAVTGAGGKWYIDSVTPKRTTPC